ncbi:ion transporter [bacterium]|nr:ion transporter [bacterium]
MARGWLAQAVSDAVVLAVVGLNAVVLLLDAFPEIHACCGPLLWVVDYICILFFVIEAIIKIAATEGRRYFHCGWNIFDLLVVLASSPALLVPFGLGTHLLAGLLVLRLARLLRFLKLMRFIPNIDRLFEGARRALRASVGILLVTIFYIFIFGIGATYFFGMGENALPEFSNPIVSMYTMFKVFTIEGWYEMADTIAGTSTALSAHLVRSFFVLAVVIGGIIILSLLNAVFVDEMSSDLAERHEDNVKELQAQINELQAQLNERLEYIVAKLEQG